MKLSIHLVTWNGAKYIPYLFASLRKQTNKDFKLVILENNSSDNTVDLIKKELNNLSVQSELVESVENLGFAKGHNRLFAQYPDYILLLNQDMYLMPDCLEKLVKFMDAEPEAAVISPRLMRWDFLQCHSRESGNPGGFTNQIDSLGLKVFRNRRVVELGAGEKWDRDVIPAMPTGRQAKAGFQSILLDSCLRRNDSAEVFGVSGALPMFRCSVIEKVGLFDESFGSYKEDVDLAFRLRSAGYRSFVVLDAVAYHDRAAAGPSELGDAEAIQNKKEQSAWVKYHSYKNHLMVLYKNEYGRNFLFDFPWILWYELKKFAYFLLFDRGVLRGLGEIWKNRKDLKVKRLKIKELRKIGWRDMRRWW